MAKARKLPSGNWRVQVLDYIDGDGKKHRRSFTAPTKKEAEYLAATYAATQKDEQASPVPRKSFGQALENYIEKKSNILSPSTIRGYNSIKRVLANDYPSFYRASIRDITPAMLQYLINDLSNGKSAKTVRNFNGLIYTVLSDYGIKIDTALPAKVKPNICVPSQDDITALLRAAEGTALEIPILLAAFGPMRRGEICALRSDCIDGNRVHVVRNMVINDNHEWVIKTPKSYHGNRFIDFPDFVGQKLATIEGPVTELNPNELTERFRRLQNRVCKVHFRFHDLRHYSASIQHALGVPDAYIMQRGGWGNDSVLKTIYRHALDDESARVNSVINDHFTDIFSKSAHESAHEKK